MNESRVHLNSDEALHQAASPADGLGDLRADESGVFWLAADPVSGARRLWHWCDGRAKALTPSEMDVASHVNGYGGGAHTRLGDTVIFVAGDHQMLYRQKLTGGDVQPWWSQPETRYGGLLADPLRQRVLAVEEKGNSRDASQCLVALNDDGRCVLAEGADFYDAPTLTADGMRLAWVEWNLPHMPWQRSRLCIADLGSDGRIVQQHTWDGGSAVTQPRFAADSSLIVISDHRGWWQPYRLTGDTAQAIGDIPTDHVPTPWQLGECHHLWPKEGGLLMRFQEGAATLWQVDEQGHAHRRLLPEASRIIGLAMHEQWLYAITQGQSHAARLVRVNLGDERQETLFALPTPDDPPLPTLISTPASETERVTAFVYFPDVAGDTLPPLIMRIHGGPTAASYPVFDPLARWWTLQGYAVADLNPRGSGNWGRAFRERLAGQWGRLDVDDAVALADELVARRLVDPERLFLRGQSAGGFTVLNTLASTQRFRAGASLYGVTDAVRLASQTHRFESGYLDWLLGDETAKHDASPVNRLDTFVAPVIFFQGGRDAVVLPDQTLFMAAALRGQGVKAEVVLFPEEGHGIRHPANRRRLIARELAFFAAHGGDVP
ncbi:peptidase S9 [Litchfieldella qijiaojingensis]|uniref:Peptidase S9 n=1 Tax=Litchfieldella qijiaojingensis TaxID=980347 RepID=A0ABQ2ZAQ1_9GAMM|nr:prolyl oligopeptidase family serine peptidase [Halomonas qijiaojingensis]GGY09081.1 peptidase S9 [Halomonas qijiaojingensis]